MKDLPKTKNIAGPPVYYPPNHEMFAHKEESGGYRAEVVFYFAKSRNSKFNFSHGKFEVN